MSQQDVNIADNMLQLFAESPTQTRTGSALGGAGFGGCGLNGINLSNGRHLANLGAWT